MSDQLLNSSPNQAEAAEQLRQELDELRRQLARAEEELARVPALNAQLAELLQLNDELLRRSDELEKRQVAFEQLAEIADRYTVVVHSLSWRLTRPLRQAMAMARKLAR
jgi:DNA repair exonuclease SbcCD ATPase subunit